MPLFKLPVSRSKIASKNLKILEAGIYSVLPKNFLAKHVKSNGKKLIIENQAFSLKDGRLFVIGFGKSAAEMGREIEQMLLPQIEAGIIIDIEENTPLKKLEFIKGSHPYPSAANVQAAKKILRLKKKYQINQADFILVLISGGGSSLLTLPAEGISVQEKQEITKLLIKSQATIQEINCVRKHLSKVKGGFLAKHFQPATVISLIISDVPGNQLDVIASGPTYHDSTSFKKAVAILRKYQLWNQAPAAIKERLESGAKGKIEETPKKPLNQVFNFILGTNDTALEQMKKQARKLGFTPYFLNSPLKEKVEDAIKIIESKLLEHLEKAKPGDKLALIFGGETTVNVGKASGAGGRNQELVTYLLKDLTESNNQLAKILENKQWSFASCGTDGIDYIKEASGGIIGPVAIKKISTQKAKLNQSLKEHNSFPLLKSLDAILSTKGSTGTNVGDVGCFLVEL